MGLVNENTDLHIKYMEQATPIAHLHGLQHESNWITIERKGVHTNNDSKKIL